MASEGSSSGTESEKDTSSQDSESSGGGEGKGVSQEQQSAQIDQLEAEQESEQAQHEAEQQQEEQAEEQAASNEPDQQAAEQGEAEDKEGEGSGNADGESEDSADHDGEEGDDAAAAADDTATESASDDHETSISDDSETAQAVDEAQAQADATGPAQQAPKPDAFDDMLNRLPSLDADFAKDTSKAVFQAIDDLVAQYEDGAQQQETGDQQRPDGRQSGQPEEPAEQTKAQPDKQAQQSEAERRRGLDAWQRQLDQDQETLRGLTEGKVSQAMKEAAQRRQERLGGALTASIGRTEDGGSIRGSEGSGKGSSKDEGEGKSSATRRAGPEGHGGGGLTQDRAAPSSAAEGRARESASPTEAVGKQEAGGQPGADTAKEARDSHSKPELTSDLRMQGAPADQGRPRGDAGGLSRQGPGRERAAAPPDSDAQRSERGASKQGASAEHKGESPKQAAGAERDGAASDRAPTDKAGMPSTFGKGQPEGAEGRDPKSVMGGPTELSRALNDIGKANVARFANINKGVLPVVLAVDQKLLVFDQNGRTLGDVRNYWKGTSGTNIPATNLKPGTYMLDTRTGEVRQFKDGKLQPGLVGKLPSVEARSSSEALGSGHVNLFARAASPERREAFGKAISPAPEKGQENAGSPAAGQQQQEAPKPYPALAVRVPERNDMMAQDQHQDAKWDAAKSESLGRVNDHIEGSLKGMVKNPEQVLAGVLAGKAGLYTAGSAVAMQLGESKAMAKAAQTRDEIAVARDLCAGGLAHAAILATGEALGASVRASVGPRLGTSTNTLLRRSAEAVKADRALGEAAASVSRSLTREGGPSASGRLSGEAAGSASGRLSGEAAGSASRPLSGEAAGSASGRSSGEMTTPRAAESVRGGGRPSTPEGPSRAGGEGGGGRPPRDTVPDHYSDTLPGRGPGGGRDTVPDYHSDTLPGRAGRESTLPGLGPQRAEPGAAGRGRTLRGMGAETLPPVSLRERWSSAGREQGRAAEAGPRAPDSEAITARRGAGESPRDAAGPRPGAAEGQTRSPTQDLGHRLNEYGVSTGRFERVLNDLQAEGLTREQALGQIQNEVRLMDHLRDEFCGGSAAKARATIDGAEGVRTAISDAHWWRQLREWHARYPEAMPGRDVLGELSRVADDYVRNLEHGVGGQRGGGAPGGGAGGGGGTLRGVGPAAPGPGGALRGWGPEASERGPAGRGGTLRGVGLEAPEPASAARGGTLRGMGPEAPRPAAPIAEHWSRNGSALQGDRLPSGAPDGTATMPALTDGQIRFLGAQAADQAGRLGMRPGDLDSYTGKLYRNELLRGRDADTARANAAQAAREQIAQVHALGQELGRELTQYGYSPGDIAQRLADARVEGLTREQTLASLGREVELANHLRDQFCGGSIEQARAVLAATGDARQGIKLQHWVEQVQAWKADNLFDSPGRERLAEFGDRADAYVRDLERGLDRGGGREQ